MVKGFVDDSTWPLIVVRWPPRPRFAQLVEHFDRIEELLAAGEPIGAVVDVDSLREQSLLKRTYVAARIARIAAQRGGQIVAVAHVADTWLARAVITTIYGMLPTLFPTRDFRHFEDARAWVAERLAQAAAPIGVAQ